MRSPLTLGVDIGGTFIKLGLVQESRILLQESLPSASFPHPKALQDGMVEAIRSLIHESDRSIGAVGIGIPGLVRYPQGMVHSCVNLRGWRHVPLRRLLSRRLRLPVWVDNDVNVMTLAEWKYGAGQGAKNLVCLTLGTGVGGGLVLEGQLYRGKQGSAGELGHIPLSEKGPRCSCGGMACLERYVGNREILQFVRQRLSKGVKSQIPRLIDHNLARLTPEVIDRACELGDRLAQETWEWVGTRIGLALTGVVNLLNPDRIVVGGGISKAGHWLLDPMRQTVRRRAMQGLKAVAIVPAALGSSAGLIGAALLARQEPGR